MTETRAPSLYRVEFMADLLPWQRVHKPLTPPSVTCPNGLFFEWIFLAWVSFFFKYKMKVCLPLEFLFDFVLKECVDQRLKAASSMA